MTFYVIEKKPKGGLLEKYRTDFEYDESVPTGEAPRCPRCGAPIGMLASLPPYRVDLDTWGDEFGDLAFWLDDFLVSRRFRDAFTRSGLKGLSSFTPASVLSHTAHGKVCGDPPEYFRVRPSNGPARVDPITSGFEWVNSNHPSCWECLSGPKKHWDRIVIDQQSWTGEDLFYPYGAPGVLVASGRFFQWAQAHCFGNLVMIPALEYEWAPYAPKKWYGNP